jgi:D-xylose transport system permease protein
MSEAATTADRPVVTPPRGRFRAVRAAWGRLSQPLRPVIAPIRSAGAWVMDRARQTEVDLRLFGMAIALALILVGIELADSKTFLQPVNLLNLAVQATPVAIIATGMVLVIVTRQIDLSVGSVVGVVSMSIAILFFRVFPPTIGVDSTFGWLIALAAGLGVGALIGGFHGYLIAYVGIPSFIVTLGGLLAWRGVVFVISGGSTIAPDDKFFVQLFAGGPAGSIGGLASWVVAALIIAGAIVGLVNSRNQRKRFGFPLRPRWAEGLLAVMVAAGAIGFVALIANAYKWPQGIVDQARAANPNFVVPPGGVESGIPNPILLMLGVMLVMSFMARRLRFGRAVFAIGGNPDAAELAGINTRWTIMKTYILLGLLCGIAGAIASARLNGASLDIGQGYELLVIAAAVIGGTSFAGGIGTIPGAILGALVMQALAYGLAYLGYSTPIQNIVSGIVLVGAVGFDTWNRRRSQ